MKSLYISMAGNFMTSITNGNNLGVDLLRTKRYQEALPLFKTTLSAIRLLCLTDEERHLPQENTRRPTNIQAVNFKPLSTITHQTGVFVHNKAAVLSAEARAFKTRTQKSIAAATTLYNMALVYHICGLECGRTESLETSITLYRQARQALLLCMQIKRNNVPHAHTYVKEQVTIERLALAIVNNMGQVFHELANHHEAVVCFEHLLDTIRQWNCSGRDIHGQHLEILSLNAMILTEPSHASAA